MYVVLEMFVLCSCCRLSNKKYQNSLLQSNRFNQLHNISLITSIYQVLEIMELEKLSWWEIKVYERQTRQGDSKLSFQNEESLFSNKLKTNYNLNLTQIWRIN